MANRPNNHSREPAITADLRAMKTEIIDAVKDTVKGLATQKTVRAVMETAAETKESVTKLTGLVTDMMQELTAMHEDVRYVRNTVPMLVRSDGAHEAAIESLRKRVKLAGPSGGPQAYSGPCMVWQISRSFGEDTHGRHPRHRGTYP
jgi:hypothetical protein